MKTAQSPTPAEAVYGIRHPKRTWDGRSIGHVEPLESDYALRMAVSRRVNFIAKQAQARESNRAKALRAAQDKRTKRRP
jgi:hypothetical protein